MNNNTRERLTEYFKKHCDFIESNETLMKSIEHSVENGEVIDYDTIIQDFNALSEHLTKFSKCELKSSEDNISVVNNRSFGALFDAVKQYGADKRYAVLNFASAKNPGGQVTTGSTAQEEALCRCSTLYQVLSNPKFNDDYYEYNRSFAKHNSDGSLYTNRIIYTPDIKVFCKDNFIPVTLPEDCWIDADIITCPAPNLIPYVRFKKPIDDNRLFDLYVDRINDILMSAITHDVDIIILGAWGCGVFKNNPKLIAEGFKRALYNDMKQFYFDHVIFAVMDDGRGSGNYSAFYNKFK